jgi:hypothetical protein
MSEDLIQKLSGFDITKTPEDKTQKTIASILSTIDISSIVRNASRAQGSNGGQRSKQPCKFFARGGNCRYGTTYRYEHIRSSTKDVGQGLVSNRPIFHNFDARLINQDITEFDQHHTRRRFISSVY